MNKTYSLSNEAIQMVSELVEIQKQETGKGNKSSEVEKAIRERHKRVKGGKR